MFTKILIKNIPNFLTSLNLLLGAFGTYFAILGRPDLTVVCVLLAAVFDFFDGFAARQLNAYSLIGKDLDSFADLISFGFAPAAAYSSLLHYFITGSWAGEFWNLSYSDQILLLIPFFLTVFSALRLAKFNNDTTQTDNFRGLTTTATGMFSVSYVYTVFSYENFPPFFKNPLFILFLIFFLSYLLVSEIPMFSLKFKHFRWKGNEHRFILLEVSLIALIFMGLRALFVIVPFYVLFSVVLNLFYDFQKKKYKSS
ncbi:MAG: CDP-alcohol phosphatidyltransferase family protein [Marinilabiliaceae bacterium]|nr:CDP-alcohol phosphatidyltransferase family protein [Marinilabiliaceae bacterium]